MGESVASVIEATPAAAVAQGAAPLASAAVGVTAEPPGLRLMVEAVAEIPAAPLDVHPHVIRPSQHASTSIATFVRQANLPPPSTFGQWLDATLALGKPRAG